MSKYNFFERRTVSTTNFANCVMSWDFISVSMLLLNENNTAANVIEYSYNGTTVAGDLRPGLPSQGIAKDLIHESRIYFRLVPGAAASVVRVEVWA